MLESLGSDKNGVEGGMELLEPGRFIPEDFLARAARQSFDAVRGTEAVGIALKERMTGKHGHGLPGVLKLNLEPAHARSNKISVLRREGHSVLSPKPGNEIAFRLGAASQIDDNLRRRCLILGQSLRIKALHDTQPLGGTRQWREPKEGKNQQDLADHRSTDRNSGPNESKLSDRGWPRKTKQAEKTRRPTSVRWSEWLGATVRPRVRTALNDRSATTNDCSAAPDDWSGTTDDRSGTTDDRSGTTDDRSGTTDDRSGEADDWSGEADDWSGEADDWSGEADDWSGTTDDRSGTLAKRPKRANSAAPNELKLSDRGWRSQAPPTEKTRPPASVRWSAWLGAWNSESGEREHASAQPGE